MGLIMALAMPVGAADVKFSGSYVAQGYYESNARLTDPEASSSFGWQRLRLGTTFQVAEGLKLVTTADIMEKVWGAARSAVPTSSSGSADTAEMENIHFQAVYVDFNIPGGNYGAIRVGQQQQGKWGTLFGDNGETDWGFRIRYDYGLGGGPIWILAAYDKVEGSKIQQNYAGIGEHEADKYHIGGAYRWTGGEAGLLITYYNYSNNADNVATGYRQPYWAFQPYMKGKFGPVYVEAEVGYATGTYKEYNTSAGGQDVDIEAWRAYAMATMDLAPAYVGLGGFFASGDDGSDPTKKKNGLGTGNEFNPCLILLNYDLGRWNGLLGNTAGLAAPSHGNNADNVWAVQGRVGVKPVPKLDAYLSVSYASLDKNPASGWVDKEIGWEVDVAATYKIYDNLSYMVGFGYLFAGDAFKGTDPNLKVEDNYLVTHKLTLTF